MYGDFSKWPADRVRNAIGPLHQQGRVLLDTDVNAIAEHVSRWQDEAARDAFGAGVAAVSTSEKDSFPISLPGAW